MANQQAQEPLLSNNNGTNKRSSFFSSLAKFSLKFFMWFLFIIWLITIVFFPTKFINNLFSKWIYMTERTVFGITGSIFLIFAGPILVICVLAFTYTSLFPHEQSITKKNSPRISLWTFPILVDGPFGVVSAAEFIGILLFSVYIIGSIIFYVIGALHSESPFGEGSDTKWSFWEMIGLRLGSIGLFCMIFLFLPVARGSILLRLIDIPFEQAARYHVWVGHLTMAIFTLHGLCYVIAWSTQGNLIQQLLEWKDIGVANLPGLISLAAGLLMWITSLYPVRKAYFELFFYTHQLYIVFVVFLALHVGDFVFSMCAGAVFLFLLDRFLRFLQSRKTVDVLSAVCHPCGTVELTFSKPANLRYNALSFIFVQVRELSWLQWHPFSVSSSPLDGNYHISVLIKVLGTWTDKLRDLITDNDEKSKDVLRLNHDKITASVEGPYGHESPYHLMYENIILVAGGIGISPFLAIISDICHRISEGKPCLPKNVLVVWAVKKSKELSLVNVLDSQSFGSSFSDKLNLDIQAYVTQESEPSLEEGKANENKKSSSLFTISGSSMSSLVGTGSNKWFCAYIIASTIGFALLFGLVEVYFIVPFGITAWWYRGILFVLCMFASIVVFGGIVAFLWHNSEKRDSLSKEGIIDDRKGNVVEQETTQNFSSFQTTRYGCRPNFKEIFTSFSDKLGLADVGVMVCGPPGLQTSVAKECRSLNMKRRGNQPIFHYNSHSFDL